MKDDIADYSKCLLYQATDGKDLDFAIAVSHVGAHNTKETGDRKDRVGTYRKIKAAI